MLLVLLSSLMTSVYRCSWNISRNWPCPTLLKHSPRISPGSFLKNFPGRTPWGEIPYRRLTGQTPWRIPGEYILGVPPPPPLLLLLLLSVYICPRRRVLICTGDIRKMFIFESKTDYIWALVSTIVNLLKWKIENKKVAVALICIGLYKFNKLFKFEFT